MNKKTIAIVGGGQAAAMAAAALRQQGFDGELHLFSDEQHLPYERPPLSKAMLLDDNPQLQPILPAGWWREHNVQLHLGVTVQTLGRQTHQLVLADGQSYPWDRLLIATGAAARPFRCWISWAIDALLCVMPLMPSACATLCCRVSRLSLSVRAPLVWNWRPARLNEAVR